MAAWIEVINDRGCVVPVTPLRILLDTNVFIAAESDVTTPHPNAPGAAELLRLAAKLQHTVCLADGIKADFNRHADLNHRLRRAWQLQRYHVLEPITVPHGFSERAGYPPDVGPSGVVDMSLLLALERGAAQWLVTEDGGLHVHAGWLGLTDRVFTISDALDVLRSQLAQSISVPAIEELKGFHLDLDDPIFDDFDPSYRVREWIRDKVAPEHRPCLVIGESGRLDSLVILKQERDDTYGLAEPVLKICTFKVAPSARGVHRGELLLWAVFEYARKNSCESIFVEVFAHEQVLITLLQHFGFRELGAHTKREGERVYAKSLVPAEEGLDPLTHNIVYGPGALRVERAFIVPIIPTWHTSLLPVADDQMNLLPGLTNHGNAIRKAYLSNSNTRLLRPGDTLLFLRTHARQQVRAIGVVEETLVSSDPVAILQFTGRRTVYTPDQVAEMCSHRPVLAIRFRLDRVLDTPLSRADLIENRAMRQSPQSVMQITNTGAITWLQDLLND